MDSDLIPLGYLHFTVYFGFVRVCVSVSVSVRPYAPPCMWEFAHLDYPERPGK